MKPVTARTRLIVLLGDPVDHSLSPELQNAAIRTAGLDAVYLALRVEGHAVETLMRTVAAAGGGGNVTLPHKGRAAEALDGPSEAVEATGACNVFWWDPELGLCGDNTDAEAFRGAAEAVMGRSLRGARILLLGAGGAARAAVHAAREAGAARIAILNRTIARAERLRDERGADAGVDVLPDREATRGEDYDLVANATSLGLRAEDPLPLELEALNAGAVLDLVYGPDGTRWVRQARELGLPAEDGRRMLVLQAAAGFRRWFDRDPPLDVMFRAVGLPAETA